jgi:hypothetical protein
MKLRCLFVGGLFEIVVVVVGVVGYTYVVYVFIYIFLLLHARVIDIYFFNEE